MQRLGKLLLIAMLSVGVVNASEKIFDLSKQEFATKSSGEILRFKISDEVMVKTNLQKDYTTDSYIAPEGTTGVFNLEFAKPLQKWIMIIEYDANGDNGIIFKDNEMNTISFKVREKLYFQEFSMKYVNPWNSGIAKNILKFVGKGNIVKLYLNNKLITKQFSEEFSGLSVIDIDSQKGSKANETDYLYNLIIKKN